MYRFGTHTLYVYCMYITYITPTSWAINAIIDQARCCNWRLSSQLDKTYFQLDKTHWL